jgi:hypothetical protein
MKKSITIQELELNHGANCIKLFSSQLKNELKAGVFILGKPHLMFVSKDGAYPSVAPF